MKRIAAGFVLLSLLVCSTWADGKQDIYGFKKVQPLSDMSADNQTLVVVSIQTTESFQVKTGPIYLSFAKVQPLIGPRFSPSRCANNTIFFFDKVQKGETYKVYDWSWMINEGRNTYYMRACPGVMGTKLTAEISAPGIVYMGAYFQGNNGLEPDYTVTEADVLKKLIANLEKYPEWKKLVEKRLEELKK